MLLPRPGRRSYDHGTPTIETAVGTVRDCDEDACVDAAGHVILMLERALISAELLLEGILPAYMHIMHGVY